jgi:hypothetical protein
MVSVILLSGSGGGGGADGSTDAARTRGGTAARVRSGEEAEPTTPATREVITSIPVTRSSGKTTNCSHW